MPAQTKNIDRVIEDLVIRSTSDADLRARLLADPSDDLTQAFEAAGYSVNAAPDIQFVEAGEAASGDNVVALPAAGAYEAELEEAQLEAVAGGVEQSFTWFLCEFTNECEIKSVYVCITV